MSDETVLLVGAGALLLLCFVGMFYAERHDRRVCEEKGGHIFSKTSPGFGNASNGQMVVTFNTTKFCISQDGRILD